MGVASLQIPRMDREWRVMLVVARIAWKPERRAWTGTYRYSCRRSIRVTRGRPHGNVKAISSRFAPGMLAPQFKST
jgi:hypothetical protein